MAREISFLSRRRYRALAVVASALLVTALFAFNVDATSPNNNYKASVTGPVDSGFFYGTSVQGSTHGTIDLTVTVNSTYNQQIGSMQVTVPNTVRLYPPSGNPTVTVAGNAIAQSNVVVSGQTVTVGNLAAQPGQSIVVSFSGDVQCASGSGTYAIVAKQANNFNGLPGNTVNGQSPTQTVTGSCSLAFVDGSTLPRFNAADAQVNSVITTLRYGTVLSATDATDYPSAGDPVTVQVLDQALTPLEWASRWPSTATINLSLNPASPSTGGLLSGGAGTGTLTATATQAFSPSVDTHGSGYSLNVFVSNASGTLAAGTTGAVSDAFNIVDQVGACKKVQGVVVCDPTVAGYSGTTGKVTPQNASAGDFVSLSVGDPASNVVCGNKTGVSQSVSFTVLGITGGTSGASKYVEIRLDNPTAAASKYSVCWRQVDPFTTASGTLATLLNGFYYGFLAACPGKNPASGAPCEDNLFIDKTVSPNQLVAPIYAPAGDPGGTLYR